MQPKEVRPGLPVRSKTLSQDIKNINFDGVKDINSMINNRQQNTSGHIMDYFYASCTIVCIVRHQDNEQEAVYSINELELASPLTNQ